MNFILWGNDTLIFILAIILPERMLGFKKLKAKRNFVNSLLCEYFPNRLEVTKLALVSSTDWLTSYKVFSFQVSVLCFHCFYKLQNSKLQYFRNLTQGREGQTASANLQTWDAGLAYSLTLYSSFVKPVSTAFVKGKTDDDRIWVAVTRES